MIRPIKAILLRNLIKLQRDRMKLFMNLFMSGLFLFISVYFFVYNEIGSSGHGSSDELSDFRHYHYDCISIGTQ